MITNSAELQTAVRNIQILEDALRALQDQLATSNPGLLECTEPAYKRRIAALRTEIERFQPHLPEMPLKDQVPNPRR